MKNIFIINKIKKKNSYKLIAILYKAERILFNFFLFIIIFIDLKINQKKIYIFFLNVLGR
jgi:hypothetical protein